MPTTTCTQFESTKRRPRLREVFWLEQNERDVPQDDLWLGERELATLSRLRFAKRRAEWRLGRWTAKLAVSAYLGRDISQQSLRALQICAAEDGAPEVLTPSGREVTISLSHRAGIAMCAVTLAGMAIGCDLEVVEARSDAFIHDYFTVQEQATIRDAGLSQQPLLANLFWSAKESALKATRTGLRSSTQSLNVLLLHDSPCTGDWRPFLIESKAGESIDGWWQRDGELLRTIVTIPAACAPTPLSNDSFMRA
ncbi:MAG TPA: 4'-phosphopantetheinyl transferase superfamily protein [Terriglobales bacterium]|nr:4'-phosphopantetheinyl transferase superfamily protein [Terriglobales bacterium]